MSLSEHVYCVAIAFKMPKWVEQRICIKFCVMLEHSSMETLQIFRRLLRTMQWVQHNLACGTNASKMVENLLKVIHVLEGLQQAKHLRMLNVCGLQSTKMGDWPRENWQLIWGFQNYCVPDFDTGCWYAKCHGKIHSVACLPEQKEHRAAVANDLIQTTDNEPDYFKKVITRDELWVYGYNLETKA